MSRFGSVVVLLVALLLPVSGAAAAGSDRPHEPRFTPGAPGAGDPYYPLDGNGGYDVRLYDLALTYDPGTDRLTGEATIKARATQDLSAFNLDLVGLSVHSVVVQGREATWSRDGGELTVTPDRGLRRGTWFRVVVRYSGVPEALQDGFLPMGFLHTDDGAVVVGQPHSAATWFPVNDHPIDRALFRFAVTVPDGLEAIANGALRGTASRDGWSTWRWRAHEAMAPYLAFLVIGEYDLRAYRADGVQYWDALDPDLFRAAPRTGEQAAYSGMGEPAYQRLTRTLSVPDAGGTVSFWVDRELLGDFHYLAVEARAVGTDDWTTLPDRDGHATPDTGFACSFLVEVHPFLMRYQTPAPDGLTCLPTGTTGEWWAATEASDGPEQWSLDLGRYAGQDLELSIAHITPGLPGMPGLAVDDVEVSWGEGTTSFEDDGDPLDGWTVTGPPPGSPPNPDTWSVGAPDEVAPAYGERAELALARQPEILDFLEELFGWYPFRTSGGVVPGHPELFFALETQTRPVYGRYFFGDPVNAGSVVVHELAHQWVGDRLTLQGWQHIWLNEGFATYAEWLWREREGVITAQQQFDALSGIPADVPFWAVTIGDPGPDLLFDQAVYDRGAMTLHALRLEVGDDAFFEILRTWVREQRGRHVTTDEFVEVAERVSGQTLDELFDVWLFTGEKPASLPEEPIFEEPPFEEPFADEPSADELSVAGQRSPGADHDPLFPALRGLLELRR